MNFNTLLLQTPVDPSKAEETADWLTSMVPSLIEGAKSLGLALIILFIGFKIGNRLANMIGNLMEKRGIDDTLRPFVKSIVGVGFKVFVLLAAAGTLGMETTSFAAALGGAFLAIGMALQGSLANFAGGFLVIVFKPFKVGDLIEAQGYLGVVKEIQIFNTVLLTPDNQTVILPNGALSNGAIKNVSKEEFIRVDMTFGIGYNDSIDEARKIIFEVLGRCEHIKDPAKSDVFVSELADSSVNFAVRPWGKPANFWDIYFFAHENIKKEFDKAGIGIPYPQMDVHVHKSE